MRSNQVKRPADLEDAELASTTERPRKQRYRPQKSNHRMPFMTPSYCPDCGKKGYHSEEAARIVIGRMLANGTLNDPDVFSFRPYMCVHGWWHTGHDPKSRRLIRNLVRGKGTAHPATSECTAG